MKTNKKPNFRTTVSFISQVENLNLKNWKITALFRSLQMEGKKGEKIFNFSSFEGKVREGLFKRNSRICPWRGTSFFWRSD
jgi:hypothetical protein